MEKERLTKRQEDTLKCIKTYVVSHGYPPTVRELAEALGLLEDNHVILRTS